MSERVLSVFAGEAWLESLAKRDSRSRSELSEAKITDDASYCDNESGLPADIRRDAGRLRFEHLISVDRLNDPCEVARCAPPWLQERRLSELRCSVPRVLFSRGIISVGDLARYVLSDIRVLPWMQYKTPFLIADALCAEIIRGPDWSSAKLTDQLDSLRDETQWRRIGNTKIDTNAASRLVDGSQTLLGSLLVALTYLEPRNAEILSSRLGLRGIVPTLDEIAKRYTLTRERIRQIETKALREIGYLGSWQTRFENTMLAISRREREPIYTYGLDIEDQWFAGCSSNCRLVEELLSRLSKTVFLVEVMPQVRAISSIDQKKWDASVERARTLLAQAAEANAKWTQDECKAMVVTLLENDAPSLGDVLWSVVSPDAHFADDVDRDGLRLVSFGSSVSAIIDVVLAEAPEPLHFREIAKRVQAIHRRPVEEKYIHNTLQQRALQLGRGKYGTSAHLGLTVAERAELALWLRERVATAPRKQWTCFELLPEAKALPFSDHLSLYVLNIVFGEVEGMVDLGRFCWAVSGDSVVASSVPDRIDISEAVEAILINAGHPLSAVQIRHRLSSERGIQENQQIVPSGRVFRVERARWGLIDRDSGMSSGQREFCLREMCNALERRGEALHVTEICSSLAFSEHVASLGEISSEAMSWRLFGLAQSDGRFKTTSGDLMYLAAWEGPRRLSIAEAVRIIAESIPDAGETIQSLRSRANALLGRNADPGKISGHLGDVASWNSARNLWFRSSTA